MTLRIQFYIKFRGWVDVTAIVGDGEPAEVIARSAVAMALVLFNKKWPGAYREELHCTGLTDGVRTVRARDLP